MREELKGNQDTLHHLSLICEKSLLFPQVQFDQTRREGAMDLETVNVIEITWKKFAVERDTSKQD